MRNSLLLIMPTSVVVACTGELPNQQKPVEQTGIIEINEEMIDFGELLMGSLATETIRVKNVGPVNLIVESITVTTPFTTPTGGGFEIEPGNEVPVSVQFIPISYTDLEGSITITSSDPDSVQISIPIYGSTITDVDGDGFNRLEAGGEDCDDDNANTYPGAIDEWYDGVDSDCAGNDDYDQDGDGFQTLVWNEDPLTGGGDCQDNNASMYPQAPDQWYDGVDSNCDERDDFDQDGDGSRSLAYGRGSDCDDTDPDINTNGVEAINGVDDDCDGVADRAVPGWNSDYIYMGTTGNDKAGWTVTTGDVNSDGKDDMLVGASGYSGGKGGLAVIISSSLPSTESTLSSAYNLFPGAQTSDAAGTAVSYISDFGLGTPVIAIGAPGSNSNSGAVYLLDGDEATYGGDLDDSMLIINGNSSSYFGRGLTEDIDMDGDGISDIFGHYRSSSNNYYWLLYGDASYSGTISVSDVDAQFSTSGTHDNTWRHMPNSGDLDGDGIDDVVHCDHREVSSYYASEANVLWGETSRYSSSGTTSLSSTGSSIVSASGATSSTGDGYQLFAACGIMPDWNGDGMDEFWAFFSQSDSDFTGIYVFDGSADWRNGADLNPNSDASYFIVTGSSTAPVATFRPVGDWDGDGVSEVGVAFGSTSSGSSAGNAWMVSSQMGPGLSYNQNDLLATVNGDDEYGQVAYGNVLSVVPGDINDDGLSDWIASDWGYLGNGGNATNMGGVFLSFQEQ
jgi:hypothetical protein